ncbi:MAG: hypothetical protein RI959_841, partial [Pseudomonadota bacterium]
MVRLRLCCAWGHVVLQVMAVLVVIAGLGFVPPKVLQWPTGS